MQSTILQTATRFLITLLLVLPVFLFVRGHNEPGGGFVAGLVGSVAVALYALAYDVPSARQLIKFDPRALIGTGLLFALAGGALSLLSGHAFLTGEWREIDLPGFPSLDIGTPLIFDFGVLLTVLGVLVLIIFCIMEE
jgi:multicomponent Na+:H+ antiporter subunit B